MNRFPLVDLFAALGVDGPDLLLRDYGRRAFPHIEQAIRSVHDGDTLWIDHTGIRVMDTSFCDETIVELVQALVDGKYGDRFLIMLNPSGATVDNLEGTIARRKAKLAVLISQDHVVRPVGHVEPNLHDTWQLVYERGTLTARELADMLGLEINTASMRLRKLYAARLLQRTEEVTEEGRQHIYQIPG